MAGNVIERELTETQSGRIRFALATAGDDAEIRRLLRENPMPGKISLSLEREPSCFADASLPGETKQTVVARDGRRILCVGSCTIRRRFVNGTPLRVGYLGGLRLDARQAGRFDLLRRGYELFRELQVERPADFYFTSIAADNERARTLLERGLPGMPVYEFIGEYVTVLLSAKNRQLLRNDESGSLPPAEEVVSLLNEHNCQHQLSPCWSLEEFAALQALGLKLEDFRLVRDKEGLAAASALWDQRGFKQTVIRGYEPALNQARPVINLAARFTEGIRLPAIGETLANAFVSLLAVQPGRPGILIQLITAMRAEAARRGIELITLGFAADDSRLACLRKNFRCREYYSRLYLVRWPGFGGKAQDLDGRVLAPEAALL